MLFMDTYGGINLDTGPTLVHTNLKNRRLNLT